MISLFRGHSEVILMYHVKSRSPPTILGEVGEHHRIAVILLGVFSLGRQRRKGPVAATWARRGTLDDPGAMGARSVKLASAILAPCQAHFFSPENQLSMVISEI